MRIGRRILESIAACIDEDFDQLDNPVDTVIMVTDEQPNNDEITGDDIKITQRYLELVGGAEKARSLIDKVEECAECLDLDNDSESIDQISELIPDEIDLPTRTTPLSTLYNPSQQNYPL